MLTFTIACVGMTQIIVYGSIFDKIRPTQGWPGQLLSCALCTGFWVGVLLFCLNGFTELFTFDYNLANFLICGWLSSGTSYIFCTVFDDDGIKIMRKNNEYQN